MTVFVSVDNGDDASLSVSLLLKKAEMQLFYLTRLCDVGTLLEDLLDTWQDESPQCVQSQTIFTLFLEDIAHRVENLHVIVKACNQELRASRAQSED